MSDEGTRSSFRYGAGGPDGTRYSLKKIQVKMTSGKIYGPYTRPEILAFIENRKLKGQEFILFEGESEWKAISSDLEFFDAFQSVLQGKKSKNSKGTKKQAAQETKVAAPEADAFAIQKTQVSSDHHVGSELENEEALSQPTSSPTGAAYTSQSSTLSVENSQISVGSLRSPPASTRVSKPASKRPLFLILILAAVAVAVYFKMSQPKSTANDLASIKGFKIGGNLKYAKSLQIISEEIALNISPMPAVIESSAQWNLPEGFGANVWVQDMVKLSAETEPEPKRSAAYWGRWAWNARWMGQVIKVFDIQQGERLDRAGQQIFAELQKRKVVSPSMAALFLSLDGIFAGKWIESQNKLEKIADSEVAQWLSELCSWMAFWENGAHGNIYFSQAADHYSALNFDLSSRVRRAFAGRESNVFQLVQTQAIEDPLNFELWFNMAEYSWRVGRENIQVANRFFITGLPAVALVPASFQRIYWNQFRELLMAFGRKSSADLAANNLELLKKLNLGADAATAKQWWDFGSEGLNTAAISEDILNRARNDDFQAVDTATLRVLGLVAPNGDELLTEAGNYLALQGNFERASGLFELAAKINPKYVPALGGLVWSDSNLFLFDKALKAYDRVGAVHSETPEGLKYMGVLQTAGREYTEANENFKKYSKAAPTDAWGHYYRALLQIKMDNSLECAKAANLGRIHGSGLIKKRSLLLLLRCKVLARIETKNTLEELKTLSEKESNSIPTTIELIEAYANAELMDQAQATAENAVRRFPRSYELRLKLAEVFERKGDYDQAVAFYNDAKKDRPESGEASIRIGRILEKQERYQEAAQNYETAARINPTYPDVYIFAARAYEKLGKFNDAARMYEREIEERPAVLQTFVEAAEFMLKSNAPQEVPKIFRKFSQDFQSDPRVLTRLAQAYFAMKDLENARQTAALALSADPNIAEANRVLALIYDQQGQYEMAKRHFESYLRLLPQALDAGSIRAKIAAPPYSIQ